MLFKAGGQVRYRIQKYVIDLGQTAHHLPFTSEGACVVKKWEKFYAWNISTCKLPFSWQLTFSLLMKNHSAYNIQITLICLCFEKHACTWYIVLITFKSFLSWTIALASHFRSFAYMPTRYLLNLEIVLSAYFESIGKLTAKKAIEEATNWKRSRGPLHKLSKIKG